MRLAPGPASNTVLVDDLDAFVLGLAGRGIEAPPIELSQAGRSTALIDPDGNLLKVAQPFLV